MKNLEFVKSNVDGIHYELTPIFSLIDEMGGLDGLRNEIKATYIFITHMVTPLVIDGDVIAVHDFRKYQGHLYTLVNLMDALDKVMVAQ